MSQHDDHFAAASLPQLLALHGQQVVYRDAEGSETTCTAVVSRESIEQTDQAGERSRRRIRKATFTTDPDNAEFGGVAEPGMAGTMDVDSVTYAISGVEVSDAGFARVTLTRPERREVARGNLRGGR